MENTNAKQTENNSVANNVGRQVVSISVSDMGNASSTQYEYMIVAACDDGSIWLIRNRDSEWFELPPIPQASSNKK
jgi:hypothetical protein